ncbi:MAG TPA: flavodoxin family protein [Methanoregulaceae archaeon]|nr:flavodoxin family protein [Methanoregulaceae archaeon]
MKSLLIVYSYHHRNTEKIARVFSNVLDARIISPQEVNPGDLSDFGLIGFGSGIYSGRHHEYLLSLADRLPQVTDGKAFIFSTAGITGASKTVKDHALLREKLQSKGYVIVGEFSCKGFNTNSFLKFFGGMNKGRPNDEDLTLAKELAVNLKEQYMSGR